MKTSIIILTHNLLAITKQCLVSIRKCTSEPYELIINKYFCYWVKEDMAKAAKILLKLPKLNITPFIKINLSKLPSAIKWKGNNNP